jgi:hypothetical protein
MGVLRREEIQKTMRPGLKVLHFTLLVTWLFACTFVSEVSLPGVGTASLDSHPTAHAVAGANMSVAPSREPIQSLGDDELASAVANFEPVLLLVFGSSLLLIAAGIKTVRSKKARPDNNHVGS